MEGKLDETMRKAGDRTRDAHGPAMPVVHAGHHKQRYLPRVSQCLDPGKAIDASGGGENRCMSCWCETE